MKTIEERFWSKVFKTDSCWEWTGAKYPNGYGAFRKNSNSQICAHRMAYEIAFGTIPNGLVICHSCDNKSCVNPNHLFVGTQRDNMQDMISKGRQAMGARLNHPDQSGELNPNAKVTKEIVLLVRELYNKGLKQGDIMRQTGVSRANVWAIVHNISWNHLDKLNEE